MIKISYIPILTILLYFLLEKVKMLLSPVGFFETPWTVAHRGSSVHGILQARILEWVAVPFSRRSSQGRDRIQISTQESNPDLPHCGQILYQLSHKGSPRILEWVAYPFFSRSSLPRNQTRVSCIAGRFFPN